MTVVTNNTDEHPVHHLDATDAMGHIHLHDPSENALHPETENTPVRLEFTDIAPTAVRARLRARLTLTGTLETPYQPGATDSICMEYGHAILETGDRTSLVTLPELHAVEPDPLATTEPAMLTHLTDAHPELITLLLRLIHPHPQPGMQRALPLALDRYGITLRLEYPHTHTDARLPFPTPIRNPEDVRPQIHALLTTARRT